MKAFFNVVAIAAGLLTAALNPMTASGEEALKFRHVTSIYADGEGLGLNHPEGVAWGRNSLIVVADTGNGRLLKFTYKDKAVAKSDLAIKLPQLSYPVRVKVNSRGEILVLDRKQGRIVRLGPTGELSGYVGAQGSAAAESSGPKSFDIDSQDNIYILDAHSGRVTMTGPGGNRLKDFRFPGEFGFFTDLAVDYKGSIFLVDGVNVRVYAADQNADVFSPLSKNLQEYMRFPAGITTDRRGRIFLVDRNGGRVIILGQDGGYLGRLSAMGWKEGLLNYPSQICLNDNGEIFIADTINSRVQIFSLID